LGKFKNIKMKKILLSLSVLSILSCENEPKVDYALFSGKIENALVKKITVNGFDFSKEIPLKEDGSFTDTLKIDKPGLYNFSVGRESSSVYLKKGFDINLKMDAKQFDETITYTGKGQDANNYLAQKQLTNEKLIGAPNVFYALDEDSYKNKLEEITNTHLEALNSLENVDDDFAALEKQNLDYEKLGYLLRYEPYHKHFAQKEKFEVSEGFLPERLKSMSFDDAYLYNNLPSYKSLALNSVMDEIYETIGEDYLNATTEDFKTLESINIPELKNDIIRSNGIFLVSPANPKMKELYDFFVKQTTDEEIKEALTEKFNKNKNLVKGMPSPKFVNYENHKGGTTSLEDLKGKYVYIDVWATWCGPCKREIPFLKEIEKEYHGKNIAFVSTSIDRASDHEKWKNMVKEEELGGIQLFADNDWQSQFVKDYAIEGIPRFILVDPEGNIVSADAPRPSSPKLKELFDELNI